MRKRADYLLPFFHGDKGMPFFHGDKGIDEPIRTFYNMLNDKAVHTAQGGSYDTKTGETHCRI